MRPLKTGYAYHGNRMPQHVEADLRDMVSHNANLIVHMFSHTDWDRHIQVMKDIVAMSEGYGMETWIDNWGLGGPPGDKSHFLAYYPDAHVMYSDGSMDPVRACLNSPDFRRFTKEWIDAVVYIGGKTVFWDEPHLPQKESRDGVIYGCACPRCRALFREKFGYEMPLFHNEDVEKLRVETVVDYFAEVSAYSRAKGLRNTVCIMNGNATTMDLIPVLDRICALDTLDNIGSDPYWISGNNDPYEFVYNGARWNIGIADRYKKDHNIWIQTYDNPLGREEDIIAAADAAYDAGARTILAWGCYGSASNNYRAQNPLAVRAKTAEAFRRIWDRERDRLRQESRRKLGLAD